MKASCFNLFFTYDDGTILGYNSQTRALIELEERDYRAYSCISAGNNPDYLTSEDLHTLINEFRKGKFIIENDVDEIAQVKATFNVSRFLATSASLTLVVTHDCNLACTYCYEEKQPVSLTETNLQAIISLVKQMFRERHPNALGIFWYGGEPLLRPQIISTLSEKIRKICKQENAHYLAEIITNGTLLSEENIVLLCENDIKRAQITLDGPKDIHNARRMYIGGKGSFDIIINNIKNACSRIMIKVRVNVDSKNADTAAKILEVLESEGLKDKVSVIFAPVAAYTKHCASYANECCSNKEFSIMEIDLLNEMMDRGFHIEKEACLPRMTLMNCAAIALNSLVINAKGQIHKCWNTINYDDEIIAMLSDLDASLSQEQHYKKDFILRKDNLSKWLAYDPFSYKKCSNCSMIPTCLGGCPWEAIGPSKEPRCPTWLYNIKERLWLYRKYLIKEQEAMKNQGVANS